MIPYYYEFQPYLIHKGIRTISSFLSPRLSLSPTFSLPDFLSPRPSLSPTFSLPDLLSPRPSLSPTFSLSFPLSPTSWRSSSSQPLLSPRFLLKKVGFLPSLSLSLSLYFSFRVSEVSDSDFWFRFSIFHFCVFSISYFDFWFRFRFDIFVFSMCFRDFDLIFVFSCFGGFRFRFRSFFRFSDRVKFLYHRKRRTLSLTLNFYSEWFRRTLNFYITVKLWVWWRDPLFIKKIIFYITAKASFRLPKASPGYSNSETLSHCPLSGNHERRTPPRKLIVNALSPSQPPNASPGYSNSEKKSFQFNLTFKFRKGENYCCSSTLRVQERRKPILRTINGRNQVRFGRLLFWAMWISDFMRVLSDLGRVSRFKSQEASF